MGEEIDPNGWLIGGSGSPGKPSNKKRRGAVIGLVTAGLVAGGVLAGTLGASAATSSSGSGGSYEGPHGVPPLGEGVARPAGPGGRHHFAEKKVSAAITATLTKKALAKVPGATVDHVGQRPDGTYDVVLTKTDKTHVIVSFDKSLNLTGVETGPPKGRLGPGGPGNGVPNGEFKPGGPAPGGSGGFRGLGGHGHGRPPAGSPEAPAQG